MRTTRLKLIVLAVCCLSLLGGAAAGMLATRYAGSVQSRSVGSRTSLAEQLQLTQAQRVQVQQIWEGVRRLGDQSYREAAALDQHREDELLKLLSKDQQDRYKRIYSDYQDRYTQLVARRQSAFAQAVERTKSLLNDDQRKKYEMLLAGKMNSGPIEGNEPSRPAFPMGPATRPADSLPSVMQSGEAL